MQSKTFTRFVAAAALAAMSFFAPASQAQGTQAYKVLTPALPSDTPGKIEVVEYFAYTCPHCAAMEPMVEEWAKKAPQDVVVKQVPIAFNAGMKPLQQLYYTLQAMDRADLHPKVFNAIHVEKKRLFTKSAIAEWVASQGVDRAKFESVFDSFSVTSQVQRADQLSQASQIDGTPSFTVGGKFLTSPVMAGNSYDGALKEVDKLIPLARAGNR
ncbi:thiol:disulfide interchange protein DsbA precursor [Bordetella ansorpii]|uniref:Thiol:disulfide interchange protein n=1 Tax=Bordetella ansorpii TaxID=288768 RepID=A0A157S7W6_9BORD|nr:thiol:disulfide interchange protein DsbA/DsbL [Bordetella ansorpii]SAI66530.1 thiol:disulfide interchange protein DsbA precursor [Bordetella ansorpii]